MRSDPAPLLRIGRPTRSQYLRDGQHLARACRVSASFGSEGPTARDGRMTRQGSFSQWESEAEAQPLLGPLMAELNVAQRITIHSAHSMLAGSDQFRAVARDAADWILEHPCPVPDIDQSFIKLARSYGALADLLEAEAKRRDEIDLVAVDREMAGLHLELVRTLAMMRVNSEL